MPYRFSLLCRHLFLVSGFSEPLLFSFSRPRHPKKIHNRIDDKDWWPDASATRSGLVPPTRRDLASNAPQPHLRSSSTSCSRPLAASTSNIRFPYLLHTTVCPIESQPSSSTRAACMRPPNRTCEGLRPHSPRAPSSTSLSHMHAALLQGSDPRGNAARRCSHEKKL